MKKRLHSFPASIQNARNFRKHPTASEKLLWHALRDRQIAGAKFRRQHPVNQFVLDFFCREKLIAIEIDGGIHAKTEIVNHDLERTEYLMLQGITVLRFTTDEVMHSLDVVLLEIRKALREME